ncbi:hypothetical protein LEMLEM_LOCUS20111, partial [Lemmus lemmus]
MLLLLKAVRWSSKPRPPPRGTGAEITSEHQKELILKFCSTLPHDTDIVVIIITVRRGKAKPGKGKPADEKG